MKQFYIWALWIACYFIPATIPQIDSSLFFVNQCLTSLCLGAGLLGIDYYLPKGHKKQIWTIIGLTTLFAVYNVLTQIGYSIDQYFFYDKYILVTNTINLLELLTLITCTLVWVYGNSARVVALNPIDYLYRLLNTPNHSKDKKGSKTF